MASHAVSLNENRFRIAEQKARELGMTPDDYVGRLIDVDALADQPFDVLLDPIRKGFEHLSDEELDQLLTDARKRANSPRGQ